MSTEIKPLIGHTSQETAFVVNDYPYGFRLRCKIRYWLEFKSGKGFRLCSQTTNPKRTDAEIWNKPKCSTYSMLAIMGLDEVGHVTWTGCDMYHFEDLKAFEAAYGPSFDANQWAVYIAAQAAYERYQAKKAAAAGEAQS